MDKIYGVLIVLGLMLLAYGSVLLSSPVFVAVMITFVALAMVTKIEQIVNKYK